MNNWVASDPIPPKYILSISEVRHQQPGDDIYSTSPVTYVKLDRAGWSRRLRRRSCRR